jgi:hypothetical protein
VILYTDTSDGPGKHWVVLYFPKHGPYGYFDSLGNIPESYGVGFEKILKKEYHLYNGRLQSFYIKSVWAQLRILRHKTISGTNYEMHYQRIYSTSED